MATSNRRQRPPRTTQALFQARDLKAFIQAERRADEKARLADVLAQKQTWWTVVIICAAFNLALLSLALLDLSRP